MKKEIDAPIAQLVRDLDERGRLKRTLILVAGEFGRDMMTEGKPERFVADDRTIQVPEHMSDPKHYGMHRHFTGAQSVLVFGGGLKQGVAYGRPPTRVRCTSSTNPSRWWTFRRRFCTRRAFRPISPIRTRRGRST